MALNQLIDELLHVNNFQNNNTLILQCINKLNIVPTYPIILVGGTNGKGSVCAYLTTILTMAGYKVGTFTSPHVLNYNERITINQQPIDDETLTLAIQQINHILYELTNTAINNLGLFKTFTLAAHTIFIQHKIDIAIIEVGIGGLNDVTNLFEPTISAVTNIHLDHCDILGRTLDEIGLQKAGIFRSHKPSFYGGLTPPNSLIQYAHAIKTNLHIFGTDFGVTKHDLNFDVWHHNQHYYGLPYPMLQGNVQVNNVALVLAILNTLQQRFPIPLQNIKVGISQTTLLGRFQIYPGTPQIILDVGHNPHAVTNMVHNMIKLPYCTKTVAIFGAAKDKDIAGMIDACHKMFDQWFLVPLNIKRGIDVIALSHIVQKYITPAHMSVCNDMTTAYKRAIESKATRIVAFGSFLIVEQMYKILKQLRA